MNLEELEKNIEQQTRNGRHDIYISTSDLKELGLDLNTKGEQMVFVNVYRLNQLIEHYKYEQKLEKKAQNDLER